MATPAQLQTETVNILQDYDWELGLNGRHYEHAFHQGWEIMLLSQGWAIFDGANRIKRQGFYGDTVILAKYLDTLNSREVHRIAA